MASIYDNNLMTKTDLERIKALNTAWENAATQKERDDIHAQAEAIRSGYGYSGGGDGGQFILKNNDLMNIAAAGSAYSNAIRDAETAKQQRFSTESAAAEQDGQNRLREAYIKNMQSKLGLEQALKADGITGGVSESTFASLDNNYNTQRNSIKSDTADALLAIKLDAADSAANTEKEAAKADADSANTRYEVKRDYDNTQYERSQDALDREFAQMQFEYQKQLDEYNRRYQAQKDALDREYEKERDALDRAIEEKKIAVSASKNNTSSSSSSDSDEAREQAIKNAWYMLNNGVYDESFPALLNLPAERLMEYAENILTGY